MQLSVEPEAEKDIKGLETSHQEYILKRLQELKDKPTGHKDSDTIRIQGRQVFKYVMKKRRYKMRKRLQSSLRHTGKQDKSNRSIQQRSRIQQNRNKQQDIRPQTLM